MSTSPPHRPRPNRRPGRRHGIDKVEVVSDDPAGPGVVERLTRRPARGDEGSVSLWFAVVFLGVLLIAGIVQDGMSLLQANVHASDAADQAARAGAQALDPVSLREGGTALAPAAARTAALGWLADHHLAGQVSASTARVSVTASWPVHFRLLPALGIHPAGRIVTQTRTAAPTTGP